MEVLTWRRPVTPPAARSPSASMREALPLAASAARSAATRACSMLLAMSSLAWRICSTDEAMPSIFAEVSSASTSMAAMVSVNRRTSPSMAVVSALADTARVLAVSEWDWHCRA
jgi:hypothetical protein